MPQVDSKPLYNLDAILLMVDGDKAQLMELNTMFLKLAPGMLSEINENWNARNFEKVAASAHKFKSSIRLWQINDAVDDILSIERCARNLTELDRLPALIQRLNGTIESVLRQMEKDLGFL
jgi:HPt (histidine-containing phosphotransfer) domain-containing protein